MRTGKGYPKKKIIADLNRSGDTMKRVTNPEGERVWMVYGRNGLRTYASLGELVDHEKIQIE